MHLFTLNLVYHSYAVTETSKELAVRNINNSSGPCKYALYLNSPKLLFKQVIQNYKKMARNFTTKRKRRNSQKERK